MDRGRGLVVIVDAADERFDPAPFGLTRDQALTSIHAALPDGRVVAGMEAMREAYRALGRGWMLAPTAWPLLRPAFDRAYACFARNRYRFGQNRCMVERRVASPLPPHGDAKVRRKSSFGTP